ncbi:MAG: hypothetical protein ACQESJ_07685 [Bacteroidota bacterium]
MKKIALLTGILILLTGNVWAQDIEVAPIRVNFTANPQESETKAITVKNHGNSKESVVLKFRDYITYKDGSKKTLPAESSDNSIAKWITMNPSYLEINPNESQTVQLNFQAPDDDYTSKWGILSVSTAKEQTSFSADKETTAGISLYGRIDVYLTYTPQSEQGANKRVKISNLKETTTEEDSVRTFSVHIDNLGNTIVPCKVYLLASNMNTLEEKRLATQEIQAYPQTSRTLELELPDTLKSGEYSLSAILDYGNSDALEGTQISIEVP